MTADKRIPVTEARWWKLHDLKQAGQTYDELLEALIRTYERAEPETPADEVGDERSPSKPPRATPSGNGRGPRSGN